MKILLICGDSMTGKTTIMKKLCQTYPYLYHPIMSYTTRPKRSEDEYGHIFVTEEEMWNKMHQQGLVARTLIDGNFYFTTPEQFVDDKINIYIVDGLGVLDVKNFIQLTCDIDDDVSTCTVLITRDLYDTDEYMERLIRPIILPPASEIDMEIRNDNGYLYRTVAMVHHLSQMYFNDNITMEQFNQIIKDVIFG